MAETIDQARRRMMAKNRDKSGDKEIYNTGSGAADTKGKSYLPGGVGAVQTWLSGGDGEGKPVRPAVPYDEASNLTGGEEHGPRRPETPVARATKPATKTTTAAPPKMAAKPKPDQFAEIRADLMASAKADAAAKAMAERKRKDAEEFSAKLKGATKKGGNKTGYDAYKSLMGE